MAETLTWSEMNWNLSGKTLTPDKCFSIKAGVLDKERLHTNYYATARGPVPDRLCFREEVHECMCPARNAGYALDFSWGLIVCKGPEKDSATKPIMAYA